MSTSDAGRNRFANRRPSPKTVACPSCDVTWRGNLDDECWSCGERVAITAPIAQVKILPDTAAAS